MRRYPHESQDAPVMRRLLALLVVLFGVAALKLSAPVTLPLAFGVFLIALFWPLQRRLERRLPAWAATLASLGAFLAISAAFAWALWETWTVVLERAPVYRDRFREVAEQARGALASVGLEVGSAEPEVGRDLLLGAGRSLFSLAGGLVLVVAYFVLGLLEAGAFRLKLARAAGPERERRWLEPLHRIASDFQRYMVVRTGVGLLSGVGSGLAAWAVGLDMAFVWGVLAFLLNYVPTLGSIVAVVPPVLFALVQEGWWRAALALFALGGVQLVTGNTIDPLLQGRYLRLSALVVLFSVVLWGWVWGIAGAFIGVPVTVALTIACARFPSTRWIALLLSDVGEEKERGLPPLEEEAA